MPFANPIVGGNKLIRPAIQSPDFITGVQGWSINRNGTAEFTNLLLDGLDTTNLKVLAGDAYLWLIPKTSMVGITFGSAAILLNPTILYGQQPYRAQIYAISQVSEKQWLVLESPRTSTIVGDRVSTIRMESQGNDLVNGERINLFAGTIAIDTSTAANGHKFTVDAATASTLSGTVTVGGLLTANAAITVGGNATIAPGGAATVGTNNLNSSPLYNEPAAHPGSGIVVGSWQAMGTGAFAPFANNFKLRDAAGVADTRYRVDAFGMVSLEGKITGGAASAIGATILTLPAGLRPSVNQFIPVLSNNGGIVIGQVDINTTGAMIWRGPTIVTGGANWFALYNIHYYAEQ